MGATVVYGSDWPVTGESALQGIETALTHRYPGGIDPDGHEDAVWHPQGRVTLNEALASYTRNGAALWGDATVRGQLRAGQLADLVVLSGSLTKAAAGEIHTLKVTATVLGGQFVHER
jgi:predicted amidohydrolase YtcJ